MTALATTKGFVGLVVVQLILLTLGMRHVGAVSEEALALAKSNRDAESYIQSQALDAASVRVRQQQVRRLERRLDSLRQLFAYELDGKETDPVQIVGGQANRFQDAIREVRDELSRTSLRFPANLGFNASAPEPKDLGARVRQLDAIRHVLRLAAEAGFDEVPANGIKPGTKDNLIDDKNFLEFVEVDFILHGDSKAQAKLLHQLLRPGKYLVVESMELSNGMAAGKRRPGRRGPQAAGKPALKLKVRVQSLNVAADGLRIDPIDETAPGGGGTGRSPFYRFNRPK